jgi:hypothetical protein
MLFEKWLQAFKNNTVYSNIKTKGKGYTINNSSKLVLVK